MKTPREILLNRHRAAEPKLDAIRQSVVAASRQSAAITVLNNQVTKEPSSKNIFVSLFLRLLRTPWQELVLPSRRLWSGLAVTWALLIVVNVAQHEPASSVKGVTAPVMMSLGEQQRLMNKLELLADRSLPVDAEPPKTFSPKPRTEKIRPQTV